MISLCLIRIGGLNSWEFLEVTRNLEQLNLLISLIKTSNPLNIFTEFFFTFLCRCLHVRALVFRPYVPLSDAGNLSHAPSFQTIRGCSSTDAKWSEPSPPVDRPEAKFFH